MRKLWILITMISSFAHAQELKDFPGDQIRDMIENFHGEAGIYVKDLRGGGTYSLHGEVIFPTASMVKIPILVSVMDKVAKGELNFHQPLVYKDSLLYAGEDILGSFKDGEKIALDKVIMLMLTMSDNTASLWLQQLGGTGTVINQHMENLGLKHTRVNSRTPGRDSLRNIYGWGQSTPQEMATLMEKIWKREVIDPATSERMLRSLKRNYWDGEALSVLPPDINTYSKNGAVSRSRSEVVLVNGRESDFVFCIMTSNQEDDSWEFDNEGWRLIRGITSLLYEYFEPGSDALEPTDERYR